MSDNMKKRKCTKKCAKINILAFLKLCSLDYTRNIRCVT